MYWAVEYLACFIECILCIYFCGVFIGVEVEKQQKRRVGAFAVWNSVIVILLNKIELVSYISIIVCIALDIFTQCVYYRKKYLRLLGLVPVYTFLITIVDLLTTYAISFIMNCSIDEIFEEQGLLRLVGLFLSKSIMIIVVVILNRIIPRKHNVPPFYMIILGLSSIF